MWDIYSTLTIGGLPLTNSYTHSYTNCCVNHAMKWCLDTSTVGGAGARTSNLPVENFCHRSAVKHYMAFPHPF